MRLNGVNAPVHQWRLEAAGVFAQIPSSQSLTLQVNETWAHVLAAETAGRFRKALG
jgi:hypothetical protein